MYLNIVGNYVLPLLDKLVQQIDANGWLFKQRDNMR